MVEKVNASELARRLGVSEGAVRKHVKRGLYRAGSDGLFDFERCKAVWETSRDPDAVLRGLAGGAAVAKGTGSDEPRPDAQRPVMEGSLVKARTAQALLKAQREQLELSRVKGELIAKADVLKALLAVVTVVTERIDGAAAQIGPRVVGLDAAAATSVAREVLNGVRAEIARAADAIEVITDQAAR